MAEWKAAVMQYRNNLKPGSTPDAASILLSFFHQRKSTFFTPKIRFWNIPFNNPFRLNVPKPPIFFRLALLGPKG